MTTSSEWDAWNFRNEEMAPEGRNLIGFSVRATDGSIGKVDDATVDRGSSEIVVDTGPWIFGRRVILPAGTVERIDWDGEEISVDLTKDQIKDSPELAESVEPMEPGPNYRDELVTYYGMFYSRRPGP